MSANDLPEYDYDEVEETKTKENVVKYAIFIIELQSLATLKRASCLL